MSRLLAAVALALGLAATAVAQPQSVVDQFQKRTITSHGLTVGYRLFVPQNYDPAVKYPLVLAAHGAGERGSDNEKHIAAHRLATTWADPASQARHPAFVLAPQVPANLRWTSDADPDQSDYTGIELATLDILDLVESEFNIDPERIYVVGLSLGGHATWDLVSRQPHRFAAAVPMSGRGFTSQADDLLHLPIWAFTGETDTVVPPSQTRRVIQAMEDLGRTVIYTDCRRSPVEARKFDCGLISQDSLQEAIDAHADLIYESRRDVGHGPWAPWFDRDGLHDWLFSKVRVDEDAVAITAPSAGTVWTGPATVTWTSGRDPGETVEVWLSRNDGRDWTKVGEATLGTGPFAIDPAGGPDAALARVRLIVLNADGRVVGRDVSEPFRLDGPGNAAPTLRLDDEALRFSPSVTTPGYTLRLTAADPEADPLTATVLYSADGGTTYAPVTTASLAAGPDPQTIPVDVSALPNSARARFRVDLSDGTSTVTATTGVFTKANTRQGTTWVQRVAGEGRGTLTARIADESALTGHRYRITLDASDPLNKTYSVTDLDTQQTVLSGVPLSDGTRESPLFGGIALVVKDAETGEADASQTGWTTGATDLGVAVEGTTARIAILTLDLLATETTYTVTMTEGVSGRSVSLYRIPEQDLRFTVTGADGQPRDVVFEDKNDDGRPGNGDVLYIVEPDAQGQPALAWALTFSATASTVLPVAGDVFTLVPSPKLGSADVFEFVAATGTAGEGSFARDGIEIVSGFPNPFTDRLTVAYRLAEPSAVRLDVIDALGRHVATLVEGPLGAGDHVAGWRADVASGVFFIRLTALPAEGGATRSVQRSVLRVAR